MILGIETSCDETAAALVTDDGEIRSSVVASQAELHARFGGVVPEVASRRHLELVAPVIREALGEAGATLDDVDASRSPPARADRRAARRRLRREGACLGAAPAAVAGRPPARPRRVALPAAARPRAAVHVPARERRPHVAARRAGAAAAYGCSARRSTTRPARPSTRARGCSASAIRAAGDRPLAQHGRPRAYAFPVARVPGLDFSFSASRPRCSTGRDLPAGELEPGAPTCRRATSGRSSALSSSGSRRRAAERLAVVGGVAANSELRAALPDAALAPLALCTDNAAMIASAARYTEPVPYPDYLSLDARATA